MIRSIAICLACACAAVANACGAAERYVPPPSPPIVDGEPVRVEREFVGDEQIIHIGRESPAGARQYVGDYLVSLRCVGAHALKADLASRTAPLGSVREELVFLTPPGGADSDCVLEVIDRAGYPWRSVFRGPIRSIPKIAE